MLHVLVVNIIFEEATPQPPDVCIYRDPHTSVWVFVDSDPHVLGIFTKVEGSNLTNWEYGCFRWGLQRGQMVEASII
eukprot:5221412-Pyramimonas_sp.AAC.1